MLRDGAGIDEMPLENYCGQCRILTVTPENWSARTRSVPFGGVERIVLRTDGQAFLCEQAAEYLVQCG